MPPASHRDSKSKALTSTSTFKLTGTLYRELYGVADKLMRRERRDCPVQSTILVHDAYMALKGQHNLRKSDRPLVLAAAAKVMRRVLIDSARSRLRIKRGGNAEREIMPLALIDDAKTIDVLELHEALNALKERCETTANIVEMRFFGGMTHAEIAQVTGLSERTIGTKWRSAKSWLYRVMNP